MRWSVKMNNLPHGGYAPGYFRENYPSYGNANHAGSMSAIDMIRNGYIQPGPAMVVYPGGAAAVTTTIRSFAQRPDGATTWYGVGGSKIYQIVESASASVIHTISASTAATYANDIAAFQSSNFYSWRASGGTTNIGKWDEGTSTYDDDWWTAALSATALQNISGEILRPAIMFEVGRNDTLYFGNGRYVGSYDGSTAQDKALDLPDNTEVKDIAWLGDRLFISAVYNEFGTPNSSIYIWDGTTNSWEAEIPVAGYVGASHVSNGTFYQFYREKNGENKLARLEGNKLVDLTSYEGSANPTHNQVTEYRGFILWTPGPDSDDIFAWGSGSSAEPARLFHYVATGATTGKAGGIANATAGNGLLVSVNDQLYYLDTESSPQYATAASWKSMVFDITTAGIHGGRIDGIRFNFEKLTSGAALSWSIENNQGVTIYSDKISYAKATATQPLHTLTTAFYPLNGKVTENFRVCLDYSTGSASAPVRISAIHVYGNS